MARLAVAPAHWLIVESARDPAVALALRRAEPVLQSARNALVSLCVGARSNDEDLQPLEKLPPARLRFAGAAPTS